MKPINQSQSLSTTNGLISNNAKKNMMKILLLCLCLSCFPAFSQNFYLSQTGDKYGVKNDKGVQVVPEKYASVIILSGGYFVVYEENPGWPMIINQKNEVMVSKTNYIGKAIDAYDNHFICQYYKDGKMADLVLIKAPDSVKYNFSLKYLRAEFVKDDCYSYVSAQTETPGEMLAVSLKGNAITGPQNTNFDYIFRFFKPCNGYASVMKNKGYEGTLKGVYDFNKNKMVLPCDFSDVEFDDKLGLIKAFRKVQTSTYDLYNMQGDLVKKWEQIK